MAIGTMALPAGSPQRRNEADDGEVAARLVVRLRDGIVILDPKTGERLDFALPSSLAAARGVTAYLLGENQLLLDYGGFLRRWGKQSLAWINRAGEVTRQETLELEGYGNQDDWTTFAMVATVVPSPPAIAAGMLWLAPASQMAFGKPYPDALAESFRLGWPAAALLAAICIACAWFVARQQRKFDRPHTGMWVASVLVLGVPAFVAYLILHGKPLTAPCPACGSVVPRVREACVRCGESWPAPRLTGVEIYA